MHSTNTDKEKIMTCRCCEDFTNVPIKTPQDLNKAIKLLKYATKKGRLVVIGRSSMPGTFSELDKNQWNDIIDNYFMCSQCNQFFVLSAETYHGSGGALKSLLELPENMLPDTL